MQYPKMLYSGDKESYSSRTVHDEKEEAKCREIGLTDYADLPEPEPKIEEVAGGDLEGSTSLSEKITWLEDQLATSQGEFIAFQNNVGAMKARIAELHGDIYVGTSKEPIDYSTWTSEQLREEITKQGKTFKTRDSKAELIAILEA
jgi:hypothetical protein